MGFSGPSTPSAPRWLSTCNTHRYLQSLRKPYSSRSIIERTEKRFGAGCCRSVPWRSFSPLVCRCYFGRRPESRGGRGFNRWNYIRFWAFFHFSAGPILAMLACECETAAIGRYQREFAVFKAKVDAIEDVARLVARLSVGHA